MAEAVKPKTKKRSKQKRRDRPADIISGEVVSDDKVPDIDIIGVSSFQHEQSDQNEHHQPLEQQCSLDRQDQDQNVQESDTEDPGGSEVLHRKTGSSCQLQEQTEQISESDCSEKLPTDIPLIQDQISGDSGQRTASLEENGFETRERGVKLERSEVNNVAVDSEVESCQDSQTHVSLEQSNQTEITDSHCSEQYETSHSDTDLVIPAISLPPIIQKKWVTEARPIEEGVEIAACPSDRRPDPVAGDDTNRELDEGPPEDSTVTNGDRTTPTMLTDIAESETTTDKETEEAKMEVGPEEQTVAEDENDTGAPVQSNIETVTAKDEVEPDEQIVEEDDKEMMLTDISKSENPTAIKETDDANVEVEPEEQVVEEDGDDTNAPVHGDGYEAVTPKSPDVVHRRLYPELAELSVGDRQKQTKMEPFTNEQLRSLYYNHELEFHDEFVDKFLQEISQKNHDFYEVVMNYYRARNKLSSAEHDVQVLQKDYRSNKDLIWELREQKQTVQGQCVDKSRVTAEITYHTAEFDPIACEDVSRTLRDVRTHLHEQLSLYAYEAQLSRLQVESHLHQLYANNDTLCDIAPNSPVQALLPHERDDKAASQVAALKTHLTILFMFQRKPAKDDVFVKDCQQWIDRLVATLVRVATIEDHLYLVNQVVRCPPGVGKWAAGFIQLLPPPCAVGITPAWGCPLLDHFITVLSTLLIPVRKREEVLYQMKVVQSMTPDKQLDNPWIIVDSDGEEDEDPTNTWHLLHENDVVAFLNQLPLAFAFRHVLLVDSDDRGGIVYNIQKTTENSFLRLFAFVTCVIRILGAGLDHFCLSRYRQLNKRIGKMIKTVVHLVSCHWECFQEANPTLPSDIVDRLQLEYNMVFQRAVHTVLSAQRLGSWQFLAQLPYKGVSLETMWKLLWMMHEKCYPDNAEQQEQQLDNDSSDINMLTFEAEDCQQKLLDGEFTEEFQRKLMNMPTSEAIFLLTTFANMAQGRPTDDEEFIQTVTKEIYEIAYIKSHTRELCSKHGRDLLTSITSTHPFVLSDLLKVTMETMDNIGVVSLYLYKDLPLHLWRPTTSDITLLQDWLMTKPISSPENQLARLIIDSLNWGFDEKAMELFLDYSMHKEMAIILVDVYCKHLTGMKVGNLVTEGIKQVASMMRAQESDEQQLANWTWEVAQKLCLHQAAQTSPTTRLLKQDDTVHWAKAPDLFQDTSLQLVAAAIEKNFGLASYLGLMISKYSHSVEDFCSEGVKLLGSLAIKSHHIPVIQIIQHVVPMFYNQEAYLLNNPTFLQVLKLLMQTDSLKRGMFFNVFPGPITKLFTGALQCQIQEASVPRGIGAGTVALFWIKLLCKLDNWNSDRDVLYVLDKLLEAVFLIPEAWAKLVEHFTSIFRNLITKDTDPTLLSSISSLFGSSKPLPSLVENLALGEFPWFMYMVLQVESVYEDEGSLLWSKLQGWLHTYPDSTVDAALQGVCSKLKFYMSRSVGRLCIYRWVHQALAIDVHHPLLPLVWQRFLLLYLGRSATEPGLPQRGSVGEKFFQSSANISLMKMMKKRLGVTVTYFQDRARDGRSKRTQSGGGHCDADSNGSSGEDDAAVDSGGSTEDRNFCLQMVRFYQTLLFWLDEPRLHDASLYLPALPTQYDPERLLQVFQGQTEPWLEVFNFKLCETEIISLANEWTAIVSHDSFHGSSASHDTPSQTASEQIVAMLQHKTAPRPPPALIDPRAPIPDLSSTLLCDQQNLLFALRGDLNTLVDFAKVYSSRVAKHVGLDCTYIELMPDLYSNETTETATSAVCRSSFNPTHKCKGAAIITCRYEAAKRNDIVSRKVDENRAEYNQVFIESLLPPPQNVCSAAVHVEFAITSLIQLLKTTGDHKVLEVGTALFYNVATFVSEDTKYYPPTCQFFSSCIEILGQEFIRKNPTQSQPLLQTILQTPALVGLLAPNFSPTSSPELFVTMYQDMVSVPLNQGPDIAVALLTKFEVDGWLSGKPSLSQREALLEVIGQALCQCGMLPTGCMESVFQVYRVHLFRLASHQYPDHYGSVLKLILRGSGQAQLNIAIWKDFLHLVGCLDPLRECFEASETSCDIASALSTQCVLETIDWLSSHFIGLRISASDYANFGLYPKWKDYIPYLSAFICFLLRTHILESATRAGNRACDLETAVNQIWLKVTDVFAPWIQPLESGNQLLSPWIQGDTETAEKMVEAWISTIQMLQTHFEGMLPAFSRHGLSHLWLYYTHMLAKKDVPKHVVALFNTQLAQLPWDRFYPDIQAVELMLALCTSTDYHRSSQEFLANMFSRCPWQPITAFYMEHEIAEIRMRLYVCFFSLLVRLSLQKDVFETTSLRSLLEQSENFDWNTLDGASYQATSVWFMENCDPKCVLAERGSQEAMVLRLLRVSSEFILVPNAACHPETPVKRCCFVRCLVQLVCKCSHLKDVNPENFHLIITNLLTEVEGIAGTVPDAVAQQEESIALCVEVLGVLNHCNPQGASLKVLTDTLIGWVTSSATSPLLMPMMSAAGRGLASITHMVKLVEACMDAYFNTDVLSTEGAGWAQLLGTLQVPELAQDKFIVEAWTNGAYLILYGFTLQQLPLSQSIDDEMDHLKRIVFWTIKAKPSASNEGKMLLWWDKFLELLMRQLALGGKGAKIVELLKKFVPSLVSLGEDKDHSGLLGAIGLGKKSQLSIRFRVLANSLAAFLSAQVASDGSLRRQVDSPGHISEAVGAKSPTKSSPSKISASHHALHSFQHLENMQNHKIYLSYKEQLQYVHTFILEPTHSVVDAQKLYVHLLVNLFPDVNYLAVVRLRGLTQEDGKFMGAGL